MVRLPIQLKESRIEPTFCCRGFNDVTSDPGFGAWYQLWSNGVGTVNTGADGLGKFDYVVSSAKAHGIRLIVTL